MIRKAKSRTKRRASAVRRLRFETCESRRLLASDVGDSGGLQATEDVNGDSWITAVDAVIIINQMDRWRWGDDRPAVEEMDVDGNGEVSSLDVLRIINRMGRNQSSGERIPVDQSQFFRSIDGTGNNLIDPSLGSAGTPFRRMVDSAYGDGLSEPAGGQRASARLISNLVCNQVGSMPNIEGLSDMVWQWGQFIDHDFDLTREGQGEAFNIAVPKGDSMFDPSATGEAEIELMRSAAAEGTGEQGPRQQVNEITSFIDGSMIYGSTKERSAALRTFQNGGLKTSEGDLLPMNEAGLDNAGGSSPTLFLAGDVRANEQSGLTTLHTLWVREHNRIAREIALAKPFLVDEAVFQRARRIVVAEIQAITFREYLPALLGGDAIPAYSGYDSSVDPRISNLFATAAYRYGHTQLPTELKRVNSDGSESSAGNLPLREAFFNPQPILDEGIDSILMGLVTNVSQEIDNHLVDDVRNFLFGPPGSGGFDLAALNIQRGRDHGLADYNSIRQRLGLEAKTSFEQITSRESLQESLAQVYGSVDDVDVWVGALAEDHLPGAAVGELVYHVVRDQFLSLRDGDRYWYEKTFQGDDLVKANQTRLADVIARNTSLTGLQDNVFRTTSMNA